MGLLAPPRRLFTWTKTSLGASFGGYRVYRRPSRTPIAAWSRIGAITVPTGYDPATVEAQHNALVDLEAGWSYPGGQWENGWDYFVTVVNGSSGLESPLGVPTLTRLTVTPDTVPWLVSNAAPFLSFPVPVFSQLGGSDSTNVVVETAPVGRNRALTRTRRELPYRTYGLGWKDFGRVGQDGVRPWRAAQAAGATMCLHTLHGDRCIGTLRSLDKFDHGKVGDITYGAKLIETSGEGSYVAADFNLPAGLVLDGTNDYASIPEDDRLDPGASAFSVIVAGAFANPAASRVAFGKGNLAGSGDGWWIGSTSNANELRFRIKGATATASVAAVSATWFDGQVHVAIGTSSGAAQVLYRDGVAVANSATVHGAVGNAIATAFGGDNAGGGAYMALAPIQAVAYYARELSADEARDATYYLAGYPGYRMPPGAVLFLDLRDNRCWNGVGTSLIDLAGYGFQATTSGGPATRGIPSGLFALLDRAAA